MTSDDVIEALKTACEKAGSMRKWAAEHGLSPAYVSDVIRGNRPPSNKILKLLGFRRVINPPEFAPLKRAAR